MWWTRSVEQYFGRKHYDDVIMSAMASQITSLTIVYSTVYSGTDQRKLQSSASLASVRRIHRWLVNSPHKGPVTRKMLPFDAVIMKHHLVTPRAHHSVVTSWHGLHKLTKFENICASALQAMIHIESILPKGPYLPCVSMTGRALLTGFPRHVCYNE